MTEAWVGVDTGGTFTDLVLVDIASGQRVVHKLPTTSEDPAKAILRGLGELLSEADITPDRVTFLAHGTTLATNSVLERRYARTGMLITTGFRDVLEIGRQRRPSLFNLRIPKPTPPTPRDCIEEIDERLSEDGAEVVGLDLTAVDAAVARLRAKEVEAVAICFLHSYVNPVHELAVKNRVSELWPEVYLSASAEVLREFREFERFSTTAINASLMPVLDRYLDRFQRGLESKGLGTRPRVMQSNGGAVSVESVRRAPVNTFFSGPAGGVIAAAELGRQTGTKDLITFDMGGTSTDICLIREGTPAQRTSREIAGFPVRLATLDIHTIGAGGGSIAWVDPGGLLKVGPQSAGAEPGPALYGLGGTQATVTDANVVLGRLAGAALIGGRMPAYPQASRDAVAGLGDQLGLELDATAAGIIDIVNVNMMGAVRVVSVERGEDPRGFALVAFGGAGPLHAAEVAGEMGIERVLVPPRPGLLSAAGLLDADVRGDFSATSLKLAREEHIDDFAHGYEGLAERGAQWREIEALAADSVRYERSADLRYFGQSFEIGLAVPNGPLSGMVLTSLVAEFHRRHKEVNGYAMDGYPVEVVNLRLALVAERPAAPSRESQVDKPPGSGLVKTHRPVWFRNAGFRDVPIYQRATIPARAALSGPAVIEQMDTTTVIPPGWVASVERQGTLNLTRES